MSTALKCPNPSCPYLFDPSRVPLGEVLTCPRCGMRFTLGPPVPSTTSAPGFPPTDGVPPGYPGTNPAGVPSYSAGPTPPGYPAYSAPPAGYGPPGYPAPPPGYHPATSQQAPPTAPNAFAGMESTEHEREAGDRPARRRPPSVQGESGPIQTIVLVVMTFALIAGVGAMVYFRLIGKKSQGPADPGSELRERNLAFEPPGSPWVQDDDTRSKLGSPMILVYKRTDPEAYMAFGAKDYSTRPPRQSELREGLSQPLSRMFENVRPEEPIADVKWLGQPALVFTFHAQGKDGPNVTGKCYALGYKGIGYWAICWAGENDVASQEPAFDAALAKFKLLDLREKWTPKETEVRPFGGHKLGYQVLDAEGIWSEPDRKTAPPTDFEPDADLLLVAKEKKRGRDKSEEATLLASVLNDTAGDALAEGVNHVKAYWGEKIKEQSDGKFTVEFKPRNGPPEGDAANPVEATAPTARFEMNVGGDKNQRRIVVVSALKTDGKLVVVQSWCAWSDREVMEAKLAQIASTLHELK